MNIQEKIQEVHSYFIDKIIKGEFTFIECDEFEAKISVDGYTLFLWISGGKFSLDFVGINERIEDFFPYLPEDCREGVWDTLYPMIKRYRQEILIKKKEEELKRLKEELE